MLWLVFSGLDNFSVFLGFPVDVILLQTTESCLDTTMSTFSRGRLGGFWVFGTLWMFVIIYYFWLQIVTPHGHESSKTKENRFIDLLLSRKGEDTV